MIHYNEKTLKIGQKEIELEYSIKKVVEYDNLIVVLYYDNEIIPNNSIAFDLQGNLFWKVNDILCIKKPTGNVDIIKVSENTIRIISDLSIAFEIDVYKKELIKKDYLR